MNVDLRDTPTLQLCGIGDEDARLANLQKKVAEAVTQAEADPLVAETITRHQAQVDRIARLENAARFLRQHAAALSDQLELLGDGYIEQLISDASEGRAPDAKALDEAIRTEHKRNLILQATERIANSFRPQAEIDCKKAESLALLARSNVLIEIANRRAEKLVERLSEAAADEVELPVNTKGGVIGSIMGAATALEEAAGKAAAKTSELERAFSERKRK